MACQEYAVGNPKGEATLVLRTLNLLLKFADRKLV